VLNLACARGYIKNLFDNAKVVRFLNGNYRDISPSLNRSLLLRLYDEFPSAFGLSRLWLALR
jgi:hypothetical protein